MHEPTALPIHPDQHHVFLAPDGRAEIVPGGDAFWSLGEQALQRFDAGWLVSEFECRSDWPNWEMHPLGDEFVYLLSGEVELLLELGTGLRTVALNGRGAIVVPKGVWHTARVFEPSRMLFVTLGGGTQHRPVGPGDAAAG